MGPDRSSGLVNALQLALEGTLPGKVGHPLSWVLISHIWLEGACMPVWLESLIDEVDAEIKWKTDRYNTEHLSQRERERLEDDVNEAELIRTFIKVERAGLASVLEDLLGENLPEAARNVIAGLVQRFKQEAARQEALLEVC
jgi:hypothetical protein